MKQEMEQRIRTAAYNTWQAIGGDILDLSDTGTLSSEEVTEIVLDANYMDMYSRDTEAMDYYNSLGHEEQYRIVREAFGDENYGY